ncbi:MAG: hypothetical protein ACOY45_06585 [Pseudomonadota bacterium]
MYELPRRSKERPWTLVAHASVAVAQSGDFRSAMARMRESRSHLGERARARVGGLAMMAMASGILPGPHGLGAAPPVAAALARIAGR